MHQIGRKVAQNLVQKTFNQRLPSFERPKCQVDACVGQLDEPRPMFIEPTATQTIMQVHCIAKCLACGAPYKGERMIELGRKITAVAQDFHPYNDEDKALIQAILPKIQANVGKLIEIQSAPEKG